MTRENGSEHGVVRFLFFCGLVKPARFKMLPNVLAAGHTTSGCSISKVRIEGLNAVLAPIGEAVVTQGAELGLIGQAHQEYEQFALVVLTFRIGTVGPTKTDTVPDVTGMPLKELFEAAWNDEPKGV